MLFDNDNDLDIWSSLEFSMPQNVLEPFKPWANDLIDIRYMMLHSKKFIGSFSDQLKQLAEISPAFAEAYHKYRER